VITINKDLDCNVTTRSNRVTLRGASAPLTHQYNIMDQLHKTPAHISILELLCLSPSHRTIFDKALVEASVPTNLAEEKFQTMVGHITSPPSLSFTEKDDMSITQPHNASLHIEAFIHKHKIKSPNRWRGWSKYLYIKANPYIGVFREGYRSKKENHYQSI